MNKKTKLMYAAVLAASIAAPIAGFLGDSKGLSMTPASVQVPFLHGLPIGPFTSQNKLASLTLANEWLNSQPLNPEALRGKVVLVNFWTYTCINWRRQLPYVRGPIADRQFEIEFFGPGVEAFAFSFG